MHGCRRLVARVVFKSANRSNRSTAAERLLELASAQHPCDPERPRGPSPRGRDARPCTRRGTPRLRSSARTAGPPAPVSCPQPISDRPRPPSAAAVVRPTLASLTMPSSSSKTAAQAPSQRGVETGIAALEPCPYVGRERNPADRPAISAACHDPRLGEGWRWPDHPIQVVADPPETAGPPRAT